MPTKRFRHVFLCPFKEFDQESLRKIENLAKENTTDFFYLISFSDSNDYAKAKNVIEGSNISLVLNADCKNRTQHWERLVISANATIDYMFFSFLFTGDDVILDGYPKNDLTENEISICRYYFNTKDVKKKAVLDFLEIDSWLIDKLNFIIGKPPYGPMQKIIFPKKSSPYIRFDSRFPFTCDQMMVTSLLKKGIKHKYLKHSFYQINLKYRKFHNNAKIKEIIREQFFLYLTNRCFIGIPFVFIRTLVKRLMRS